MIYHKFPKYSDTQQITVITLKFEQGGFTLEQCVKKDAEGIANSVDPDPTAHVGGLILLYTLLRSKFRIITVTLLCEPWHDKINKMTCAPNEDSDQPGRPPSLIRVFARHS